MLIVPPERFGIIRKWSFMIIRNLDFGIWSLEFGAWNLEFKYYAPAGLGG
jgi:hypothetical protein